MPSQELVNYIKTSLGKGVPRQEIEAALRSQGWKELDIIAAYNAAKGDGPKPPQPASAPKPAKAGQAEEQVIKTKKLKSVLTKKNITIGVAALLVGALIWAGVWAINSYEPKSEPKSILTQGIDNTLALMSAKYHINAGADIGHTSRNYGGEENRYEQNFVLTGDGAFDVANPNNQRFKSNLRLSIDNNTHLVANFHNLNYQLYTYLQSFDPFYLFPRVPGTEMETADYLSRHIWLETDWGNTDMSRLHQFVKYNFKSLMALPERKKNKLIELHQERPVFRMIDAAEANQVEAKINGQDMHFYKLIVDIDNLQKFLTESLPTLGIFQVHDAKMEELIKQLDDVKDLSLEFWIGKDDLLIHKVVIFGKYNKINDDWYDIFLNRVNIGVTLSEFNQPVEIARPPEPMPFYRAWIDAKRINEREYYDMLR